MKAKLCVVFLVAMAVAGCTKNPTTGAVTNHMRPVIPVAPNLAPEGGGVGGYVTAVKENIDYYRSGFLRLEGHEWSAGEANLVGGTVGTLGALAHSIPAVAGGAAVVGTGQLLTRFYGTEAQNDAYRTAYQASSCLLLIATNLQSNALGSVESPVGGLTTEQYVVTNLNDGSMRIYERLIDQLRKRAVSKDPDFDAFQTYMSTKMASMPAETKGVDIPAGTNQVFLITGEDANGNPVKKLSGFTQAELQRVQLAVGTLKSDIGLCLTRE